MLAQIILWVLSAVMFLVGGLFLFMFIMWVVTLFTGSDWLERKER